MDPDGEPVTFSVSVPAGWTDWNTEQALLSEQMKELGIEVTIEQPDWGAAGTRPGRPGTSTRSSLARWRGRLGGRLRLHHGTRWITTDAETGEENADFNFGRYSNPPEVDAALNTYASTDNDADRAAAMTTLQQAFVRDVPAIPLGSHPLLGLFNERSYTGWPTEEDMYASADPTQAEVALVLSTLEPVE